MTDERLEAKWHAAISPLRLTNEQVDDILCANYGEERGPLPPGVVYTEYKPATLVERDD